MLLHCNTEDMNFNMAQVQQQTVNTPDNVFDAVWTFDNGYSDLTYSPGEFLHYKDILYDDIVDFKANSNLINWTKNTASFISQVNTAPIANPLSSMDGFLSPKTLNLDAALLGLDTSDKHSERSMDDESIGPLNREPVDHSPIQRSESPLFSTKRKSMSSAARAKRKLAATAKSRARVDAKSRQRASLASSPTSSSNSNTQSARYPNSGHGGNHSITLRTASRKPKPAPKLEPISIARVSGTSPESEPSSPDGSVDNLTSEERRARQNHNVVEKQYRNRLNVQFEKLLAILPANQKGVPGSASCSRSGGGIDDRRMSKAEVLELARRRINALEQERTQLQAERRSLLENISMMQQMGSQHNAST